MAVRQPRALLGLRFASFLLIAFHLLAPRLGEEQAWGLWPFTYLPPLWRGVLAGLAVALCLPGFTPRIVELAATGWRPLSLSHQTVFAALAVLSLVPFSLFHIVHTRWGDAHILVHGIAYPDPALRITATWQAPLDVWLHARLWLLGHRLFGWADAWPVYRLLSPLAGALFVYSLLRLADSVGQNRVEKLLIVGLMATLGTMQLFFGYAENYVLAAVGVLLFLWLTLETLAGRRPLWQPALALAVTNGLHPSTLVLDPALLYVAWAWNRFKEEGQGEKEGAALTGGPVRIRDENSEATPHTLGSPVRGAAAQGAARRQKHPETDPEAQEKRIGADSQRPERKAHRQYWWQAARQIALPMVLVAGGVIALMTASGHGLETLFTTDRPGGQDARWFVPLQRLSTRWEHYTMFSWLHLRDFLNEQVLTAPVTLAGLLVTSGVLLGGGRLAMGHQVELPRPAEAGYRRAEIAFLALCTLLYWLFTWVWNPDYGGQRDWDLFSLAAIPSTLLLARLLPQVFTQRRQLAQAGLMLTAVSAMHTISWIYQNTLPWEWP